MVDEEKRNLRGDRKNGKCDWWKIEKEDRRDDDWFKWKVN